MKYKNALGSVQRCITNIFILEVNDFMRIIDQLLLEVGDKYHFVPGSDDDCNQRSGAENLTVE